MSGRARLGCAISCTVIVLGAACSSASTGPSASQLAQHFDSLYSAAYNAAAAHNSTGYWVRTQVMTELEVPSAFGAVSRDVTISTVIGVEHWKGLEYIINPGGGPYNFNNILAVYRDVDAHTALVVSYGPDGSISSASLLVNDTLRIISNATTGSSALTASHDGCPAPPTLMNRDVIAYTLATCASAEFRSSASAEFAIGPGVDSALAHLAFGATAVPGETFKSWFPGTHAHVEH